MKFVNESEAVKNMTLILMFVSFCRALKREKITSRFNLNKLIYQRAFRSKYWEDRFDKSIPAGKFIPAFMNNMT